MAERSAAGKEDPREIPAYGISEAAHYLDLPKATLRSWLLGQEYRKADREEHRFRPVLRIADRGLAQLSFMNLVEAHVLSALRREHRISLQKVRRALAYVEREFPSIHPLADHHFVTDGLELFVERYGELVNVSREGQLAWKRLLEAYLSRIDRDAAGFPLRLFPFTRRKTLEEPRAIVIDPAVSFGRPVLVGTGVPTAVIAQRLKGGESIEDLARDYGRSAGEIEEAIRCELKAA